MARAWFFLVLLNSSSFSATRLSISCLTWASSCCARSTLFSSISKVASASSNAACSSSFSVSNLRRCFLPSLMWPLLLLMQLVAPPFLFPIYGAVYQVAQQLHPELLSSGTTLSYNSFLHLGRQQLQLGQPFTKDLVKILCTLFGN